MDNEDPSFPRCDGPLDELLEDLSCILCRQSVEIHMGLNRVVSAMETLGELWMNIIARALNVFGRV